MKSKIILLISILSIAFLSLPVEAAETFNETIFFTGGGTLSETISTIGSGIGTGQAADWGSIQAFYNNFDNVKIIANVDANGSLMGALSSQYVSANLGAAATGLNQDWTVFTATVGGQAYGSGNLGWYRTTANRFHYKIVFTDIDATYANTLTGKQQVVLTFDKRVYTDYISPTFGAVQSGADCTYTNFQLRSVFRNSDLSYQITCVADGANAQVEGYSVSDKAMLVFNNISNGFGWVNVTKYSANFQIEINNSLNDTLFNKTSTANVAYFANKTNGVGTTIIHQTLGNRAYRQLVDSSGVPQGVPTPTPTPTPPPSGGGGSPSGQIYFDAGSLNIGNNYGINASISAENFSSLNAYYVEASDSSGIVGGFPVQFDARNFSTGRLWTFDKTGTWHANLSYCSYINFLCPSVVAPTLLDTATLQLSPVSYTYNVTTNKPNYVLGENITVTATNPGLSTVYLTAVGPIGGSSQFVTEIAWNTPVSANSVKVFNATIPSALVLGTYYINMVTTQQYTGLVARGIFNITTPSPTSNTLGISWNDLHPILGQTDVLNYTSNFNISIIKIYNTNQNNALSLVRTIEFNPNSTGSTSVTFTTPGNWYASINDQNTTTKIVWANTSVFAGNPTNADVQKTCTSTDNYACWDKSQYIQGQAYTVNYKYNFPAVTTYIPVLRFIDPDGKVFKSVPLNDSTFWNTTVTGSYSGSFAKTAKTGVWFVKVERINTVDDTSGGELASSATEVIATNTSVSVGIPSGAAANSGMANNLNTFMSTAAFWGVLIFAFVIIGATSYGQKGVNIGFIGFVVANIEAVAGLWAPYTWYVLIIIWVAAGIFYTVGSKASGTD